MTQRETIELQLADGVVKIVPAGEGRRRVMLEGANPAIPIVRESCETSLSLEVIEAYARQNFGTICDSLARHEDPEYIQNLLQFQLLNYFRVEEFGGRRMLDFGCGSGASTAFLAQLLPRTEIVGVDLSESHIAIAKLVLRDRGLKNVEFLVSPDGSSLPEGIGQFDFIMMSAVFEHLLPEERTVVMPLLWAHLKEGGSLLINQTPHKYFPYEHHSSGLWGVNYLPDAWAKKYVQKFSKMNPRINQSNDWRMHLRGGLRGASEREILRTLRGARGGAPIVRQPLSGDRAEYWLRSVNQSRWMGLKRLVASFFRLSDRCSGVVPSMNVDMVIQKGRAI